VGQQKKKGGKCEQFGCHLFTKRVELEGAEERRAPTMEEREMGLAGRDVKKGRKGFKKTGSALGSSGTRKQRKNRNLRNLRSWERSRERTWQE